jgi:hypothetical protein
MIILSHNFDFYRIISSRLNLSRKNKLHASKSTDEIKIEVEHYQGNPFNAWKEVLKSKRYYNRNYTDVEAKKHILSLITFVRNLIEYSTDKCINTHQNINEDKLLLTHLLHSKQETRNIKFKQLKLIYGEYIKNDEFDTSIDIYNDSVYELILDIADKHISYGNIQLENKIILAIAIRLKSEEFMKNKINISSQTFSWQSSRGRNRNTHCGNKNDFLSFIDSCDNQMWELFSGYSQIGTDEEIQLLDSVNIMTPENIHLNSFMYEPLLDMDIVELKTLYRDIDNL